MLTPVPIKSATKSVSYFEEDNYYLKDVPGATPQNFWYGKTAKELKLSGEIQSKDFENILLGFLPNGERLGVERDGEIKHRPGWDLTFSAPKSVSIAALVGKDEKIVQAHIEAVKFVLDQIEKECAQARVFEKGQIKYEDTGNALAALFTHNTSRELDPDLHTHSVIANVTQRLDGKFRSMASELNGKQESIRNGFIERVFHNVKYYRSLYYTHLAHSCTQLGYGIDKRKDVQGFELKGIPDKVREVFSKRREQIVNKQKELGRFDVKSNQYATLSTRQKKQQVDHEELLDKWIIEAKEYGFNVDEFVKTSVQKSNIQANTVCAKSIVCLAISHLSERESVFKAKELEATAMFYGLGDLKPSDVIKAVDELVSSGELKSRTLIDRGKEVDAWTTKGAIKLEKKIIEEINIAKLLPQKAYNKEEVQIFLQGKGLTPGQLATCQLILTSKESILGIQGFAGTGKTTLLNCVREFYEKDQNTSVTIRGVAPQGSAANQLQLGAKIPSQTLYSFLSEQERAEFQMFLDRTNNTYYQKTEFEGNLIIVDESSMISNRDLFSLLQHANNRRFKVILLGDEAQLGAIEAGKPFSILQKNGMTTEVLQDIVRQSNTKLKDAIYSVIGSNFDRAFTKLSDCIYEIPNLNERYSEICRRYLSLNKQDRANALVLTASNEDRENLNDLIRDGLVAQKELGRKSVGVTILENKGLTRVEQRSAINYNKGDQIRFNSNCSKLGITKGDYYKITEISVDENKIILSADNNQKIIWYPDQVAAGVLGAIEVYQPKERKISKNELIRWTRNNKYNKQTNAEMATVLAVGTGKIKARLQNGEILTFDPKVSKNQHYEYAYANTAHFAQGQTCKQVFALCDEKNKRLTSMRSFYVLISRAKENAFIFTDSKDGISRLLNINSGEKTSALEGMVKQKQNVDSIGSNTNKANKFNISNKSHKWDAKQILDYINDDVERVAEHILGSPNPKLSNKSELRYGNKGSLVVSIAVSSKGLWMSHEEGVGGNLLQLIQHENLCSFSEALDYAAGYLGLSTETIKPLNKKSFIDKKASLDPSKVITSEDQKQINNAKYWYRKSIDIKGTIAEKYLREHRGITIPLNQNQRFLPSYTDQASGKAYPALLSVATNAKGEMQAVQIILLDPITAKKANIDINKRIRGRMKFGASVTVQHVDGSNKVLIAEGIETAHSLAEAFPEYTVKATLSSGNFAKVCANENTNKSIVICVDNDGVSDKLEKIVKQTVLQSFEKNQYITVSYPKQNNKDFNDVHLGSGIKQILNVVNSDIQYRNKHYHVSTSKTHTPKQEIKSSETKSKNHEKKLSDKFECEII